MAPHISITTIRSTMQAAAMMKKIFSLDDNGEALVFVCWVSSLVFFSRVSTFTVFSPATSGGGIGALVCPVHLCSEQLLDQWLHGETWTKPSPAGGTASPRPPSPQPSSHTPRGQVRPLSRHLS